MAVLVDRIDAQSLTVTLVNTDPATGRSVIAQAGSFGEHLFTLATVDGIASDVKNHWLRIDLAPGASAELRLAMPRFAHPPPAMPRRSAMPRQT